MLELYLAIILLFTMTPGPADNLYYDVRATHDMALLRGDVTTGDRAWGLIRVAPEPHSGSATIPGAYVEVETGKVVMPSGESTPVIIKEGAWELIALLHDGKTPTPKVGRYTWTERITRKRKLDPEDIYSPFAKGGILLSRLDPTAKDEKQFAPFYLIPLSWESAVQPAYQYFKRHPELSSGQLTQPHETRLLELLRGNNPVLSTMALQRLFSGRRLDDQLIRTTLEKSGGPQRAVFTYLLLASPENTGKTLAFNTLTRLVASAKGADELRPVALGALTAVLFDADSKSPQSSANKLLTALRERSVEVGAGADEYLLSIFGVARVGK